MINKVVVFLMFSAIIFGQKLETLELAKKNEAFVKEQKTILEQKKKEGFYVSPEVEDGFVMFDANGVPLYVTVNDASGGRSVNADEVWNLLYNGSSFTINGTDVEVYVWDQGAIRATHQEFGGRVTLAENNGIASHSTKVAGVIAASGMNANAKGMAPNVNILSYDYGNYLSEIPAASAAILSNHSYGIPTGWQYYNNAPYGNNNPGAGWYFISNYDTSSDEPNLSGNYNSISKFWDDAAYSNPTHTIVKSSGNSNGKGPNGTNDAAFYYVPLTGNWLAITATPPINECANGYDCLLMGSAAKNIIVVGSVEQLTTANNKYTSPSNIVLSDFTSVGPRDDGGIKPDVVAIGRDIFTSDSGSNTAYSSTAFGTSYSAPAVTGVIALWEQLYNQEEGSYMRADLAKAMVCHNTNEAGIYAGPDYHFGWGIIDAKKGVISILENNAKTLLQNNTLVDSTPWEQTIVANGTEPLKVTISWLDPSATPIDNSVNDRTSRLVNDLDLRVVEVSSNTEYFPWKLDPDNPAAAATKADNTVDNVEQIVINNPMIDGQYKIIVSHKGILLDNDGAASGSSPFGLVASGLNLPLNVEDLESSKTEIRIYPNPVKDQLHISFENEEDVKSISIFDSSGKLVMYTNEISSSYDVSHLESGNYIVFINKSGNKVSKSFIKR